MRTLILAVVALALVGCTEAGTIGLRSNGTSRVLSFPGQPVALADCLTTRLDEDRSEYLHVTRSRTLESGGVELQAGYPSDTHILVWMATFVSAGPASTRVELITRDMATILRSGNDVAQHIQSILVGCSAR
ncbi:hypothetical protein [Inquilinus sp.]|jgi:hypothetical protein|uniref:hypothetical protein n=1 Tax=Inquilinus sp. TaxID=1932117 RepID=UPI0037842CD6